MLSHGFVSVRLGLCGEEILGKIRFHEVDWVYSEEMNSSNTRFVWQTEVGSEITPHLFIEVPSI